MNCRSFHKNLIGYIEQTVPADMHIQITKHLEGCSECKKLYEEIQATYKVYDGASVPELNPFFYTRLGQKLENKSHTIAPAFSWILRLRVVAALFLMIIGVGIGITIGVNLSSQEIALKSPDRNEILKAYASDYYLSGTTEESIDAIMFNE